MYTKIIHGWVEQIYDSEGKPLEQTFVPSGNVDRRDENDDPIEDPVAVAQVEDKEKLCATDMVQP